MSEPGVEARMTASGVMVTRLPAVVSGDVAIRALASARALIAARRPTSWLIDGEAVAQFDVSIATAVQDVLGVFRRAGGRRVAFATTLPLVRLAAISAGLGLGLRVKAVDTRAEGERWLGVPSGA